MSEKLNTYTSTWMLNTPLFTAEDVRKITRKATRWQKFKLLFVRSQYSFDENVVIRYKKMDGIIFVMKRGTTL